MRATKELLRACIIGFLQIQNTHRFITLYREKIFFCVLIKLGMNFCWYVIDSFIHNFSWYVASSAFSKKVFRFFKSPLVSQKCLHNIYIKVAQLIFNLVNKQTEKGHRGIEVFSKKHFVFLLSLASCLINFTNVELY